jgi:hypothetical protein
MNGVTTLTSREDSFYSTFHERTNESARFVHMSKYKEKKFDVNLFIYNLHKFLIPETSPLASTDAQRIQPSVNQYPELRFPAFSSQAAPLIESVDDTEQVFRHYLPDPADN